MAQKQQTCAYQPGMLARDTTPAADPVGTSMPIDHIVLLMQENRSFDHYFGTLRGVRGFGDPRPVKLPSGKSVWHQPNGQAPKWELPDLFGKFPQFETDAAAYYRPYPEFSRRADSEPVHPQIVAENGPDSAHFRYVHAASVTPVSLPLVL